LIVLNGFLKREDFSPGILAALPGVPKFILSVGLQRAATVIRNHIETTRDVPPRRIFGSPEKADLTEKRAPTTVQDKLSESLLFLE